MGLISSNWKEQNFIEHIPLNCRNVPDIIYLIQKQTGKTGYTKGCIRECHFCHRIRCV